MRRTLGRARGRSLAIGTSAALAVGLFSGAIPYNGSRPALAKTQTSAPHPAVPAGNALPARSIGARAVLDQLPMTFEPSSAGARSGYQFISRGDGFALYFTGTDATLVAGPRGVSSSRRDRVTSTMLRFHLVNGNPHARMMGVDRRPTTVSYFEGANAANWRTNIPTFAKLAANGAYPGVNLLYYGNQGRLEYDFQVAAGAHVSQIRLVIAGSTGLQLDKHGNLLIGAGAGRIVEARPIVYQPIDGRRHMVAGRYTLLGGGMVGFAVGAHDSRRPLVIDPVLTYSDVFGTNDSAAGIALDRAGNAYVVGTTYSSIISPTITSALTTTGVIQEGSGYTPGACPSDAGNPQPPCPNVFIAKINPHGNKLLYYFYLGGTTNTPHAMPGDRNDFGARNIATGISVDPSGNAYIVGYSNATDFPTTAQAYQPLNRGGYDTFIAKINPGGSKLLYSTLLGGALDNSNTFGDDIGTGIAVDHLGNAYVTGYTYSYNFPIKNGLLGSLGYGKGTLGTQYDAFVTKLNPAGSDIVYSTYLGGSGSDAAYAIALDPSGDAYVTGQTNSPDFQTPAHALQPHLFGTDSNSFVAKLNKDGNRLVYATYFGRTAADKTHGIAVDVAGNAFVVGETNGGVPQTAGFAQPTSGGGIDAFVAKISARGVLTYSTYLGGVGDDIANAVAVDGRGNAYVTGSTGSASFNTPVFPLKGALQGQLGGNRGGFGMLDAFVAKVNSCGSGLLYSSYFGGTFVENALGIAVDGGGNAYVAGSTLSPNFPLTPSLSEQQQYIAPAPNAFIAKISGAPQPPSGTCPVPLTLDLSSTALSVASTIPLTVTVHTAPFAKVNLTLVVKNTVPPPPPPTPLPTATPAPTATPVKGHKPPKVKPPKPIVQPKGPVYPKIGDVIYRAHLTATADAYGLYVGAIHPHFVTTIAEPATLTVTTSASHSTASTRAALSVGP